MKRLAKFVRSVIPADPAQLIFLGGVVCLTVAPHLRWWPQEMIPGSLNDLLNQQVFSEQIRREWGRFLSVAVWPITFSGIAGYLVCFWPGSQPVRRVLWSTCLPAVFGLSLICGRFLYISGQPPSIFESASDKFHRVGSSLAILWGLGPGCHFCLLGIVLIAIFVSRLALGKTSLPLSLHNRHSSPVEDPPSWQRLQMLIWVFMGPLFVVGSLLAFVALVFPYALTSHLPFYAKGLWFSTLTPILTTATVLGLTFWITGRGGAQVAWRSTRLTKPKYLLLAFLFPVGLSAVVPFASYLFDRAQWAAHDFGSLSPPQFQSYFDAPDPWLLLLFFGALAEEIVFRGLVQPQFIQRYGLYRGIFLVGVVWAAIHFSTDSYSGSSDVEVLLRLGSRVFTCLALAFVLGWLTLRSGSVLPATVAHTFSNVVVLSQFGHYFPGRDLVRIGLWAFLAYILFRYWPVRVEDETGADRAAAEPQPML